MLSFMKPSSTDLTKTKMNKKKATVTAVAFTFKDFLGIKL